MLNGSPLGLLIKIGLSLVLLALALEDVRHQKVGSGLPLLFSSVVLWRSVTVLPALGLLWGALLVAPVRSDIRQPRWLLAGGLVIAAAGMGVRDHASFVVLVWLIVIALWRLNLIGGADAQLQLLLLTLFPSWAMAKLLLLIPLAVRLLYVLSGRRGRQPMLPAYACAGLLQLWSVV
jgi:hypothetical protein